MEEIKKLGKCPYCQSSCYERQDLNPSEDYISCDCICNDCGKEFNEYFHLKEITFYQGEQEKQICESLQDDEKKVLIEAMDLLINEEQDTINHTELILKLKGELKAYDC